MNDFFKEIFAYHHHFNQLLLIEFEKHEGKLPERSYPLFCHVINAQQIWNARILDQNPIGVKDLHAYDHCRKLNELNFQTTLRILDQRNPGELITYSNTRQRVFKNTISEILFHAANHSTHHKGQILSDFRQAGIEPLVTDYIFYKRQVLS